MTTRARAPKAVTNGAGIEPDPTPALPPTVDERVAMLEQQMAKMAGALAAIMAQQMQPQVTQGIFAQLMGAAPPQQPTPAPTE